MESRVAFSREVRANRYGRVDFFFSMTDTHFLDIGLHFSRGVLQSRIMISGSLIVYCAVGTRTNAKLPRAVSVTTD